MKYIYKKINLFYFFSGASVFINHVFLAFFYMAHATIIWVIKIREMRVKSKKIPNIYKIVLQAALINNLYNIFFFFLSANFFLGSPYKANKP